MVIDFRNTNILWASVLVETLVRLGLRTAVVSPGSRSTPLTVALASHPQVEAVPVLDERSAGFFALGIAKHTGIPVVLVCTSGTAGANYFPAVIEARESQVPLLVLTADRPPELRDCASGQTIDQQKLFGDFPNVYTELAVPVPEIGLLRYLRQTLSHLWY
ncbi:2-succinyl-5-enolpyruvyl-6-hydroxy-3-cyclohexene-1-carboxylic-acid synthase, partial [filamentous cyanobacterium CCP5]